MIVERWGGPDPATRPAPGKPVDVVIGVYGKPYHSAVTIASLLRWSGQHIGRIFIQKEKRQPHGANVDALMDVFSDARFTFYTPEIHIGIQFSSDAELAQESYRRSLRYQFAWEESASDYLFIAHNDCLYTGDIIGGMLERMEGGTVSGIGLIGQCWNCPASLGGQCGPDRFDTYRPSYEEAIAIVEAHPAARTPAGSINRERPMPFPECRVNEFSCLINMRKARPETAPQGGIPPFGRLTNDIGTEWFRQMVLRGHRFKNWFERVVHAPFSEVPSGFAADHNKGLYESSEERAARHLQEHYPLIHTALRNRLAARQNRVEGSRETFLADRPYVVLFKAHRWDAFAQRQLDRVVAGTTSGDVFVLLLGDAADRDPVRHDADKILRIKETDCAAMGLVGRAEHPFFWYGKDYPALCFHERFGDYRFYIMLEYDAATSLKFDDFAWKAAQAGVDFAGDPGAQTAQDWIWSGTCDGVYTRDELQNWTLYVSLFSNRALKCLAAERRAESRRFLRGEIGTIPFSEAAVPTLLARHGLALMPLADFGETTSLTWDRVVSEEAVAQRRSPAFFHPVAPEPASG